MTEPKFVEFKNSEWKKHYSCIEYPTIDFVVIKEQKEIGRQGIYTLTMNKVRSIHGFGYMAGIWSGGSGQNSDFGKDYDSILEIGLKILHDKSVKFEKEYEEMRNRK